MEPLHGATGAAIPPLAHRASLRADCRAARALRDRRAGRLRDRALHAQVLAGSGAMCTASWLTAGDRFHFLFNRDERRLRAAGLPPRRLHAADVVYLSP